MIDLRRLCPQQSGFLAVSILLISLLPLRQADAAFGNYNSMLIGENASGLGGAFTALYKDSSAVSFYNPAGLGFFNTLSASASASVYKKFDVKYGDLDQFTTASLRVNQGFFRGVPSASGSVFTNLLASGSRFGGLGTQLRSLLGAEKINAAFSIVVPDHDSFSGEIRSTASGVSLLTTVDESLWVGGGLGFRTSEDDALGVSLYYTARNYSRSVRERLLAGGTDATVMSEEKNILGNSIVCILGYQFKTIGSTEGSTADGTSDDEWRFGVSLRPPSIQINGSGSYFQSVIKTAPFSTTSVDRPNVTTLTEIPAKLTFGAAWIHRERLTISADVSIYDQTSYDDMTESGIQRDSIQHKRMANINLGAEAKLNPWLLFRVGAYTNFSSHPEPGASPSTRQAESVDQAGFSANFAIQSNENFRFTFGGYYTGGRGQSVQVLDQTLTRVSKSQQVFTMLIGTAFTL